MRHNEVISHKTMKEVYEMLPEPKWYDYVVQAAFMFFCLL